MALSYLGSQKTSEEKFYKSIYSSALSFFIAHLIILLFILIINASINSTLEEVSPIEFSLLGVHGIFYLFEITALVTYIVGRKNYKECEIKTSKTISNSKKGESLLKGEISNSESHTGREWRCPNCGKTNPSSSRICKDCAYER